MSLRYQWLARGATVAGSLVWLVLATACGGGTSSNAGAASTPSTASSPTPTSVASTAVPTSCAAIPSSLIGHYIGGVATTKSLGPPPHGVSCEFANSSASTIVIVNIGQGSTAKFAALRTISGQGGRTVTSVSGLGSSAFSITNAGKPGGMAALDAQDVVFSVSANLPLSQDEALITQLMQLF